jgi:hypothetical protein
MPSGSVASTDMASSVERSSVNPPPMAKSVVDAKKAVPFCNDAMICMSTIRASRSRMRRTQTSR